MLKIGHFTTICKDDRVIALKLWQDSTYNVKHAFTRKVANWWMREYKL